MKVQPYVFFDGKCDDALEFYKRALGAKVNMLMRFSEAPDQSQIKPESKNKVMHCSFQVGETEILASDGRCMGQPSFQGFALTINATNDAEAKRIFIAISEGGQVQMPLEKTFFASSFGMAADKFGVGWMVIAAKN
ncbi:MAG TPA: VOC family protein [Dongiaceae bacterium]|jgi:PhnB protein|nr:VOC family protein [Dongiaceae bacterium]